jgi:hypothetical protein
MKANKIHKRLAKIEVLMTKLTERCSANVPHIRELLRDAKAAVIRAKEAVQASSWNANFPPVKHPQPTSKGTPESSKPKRKLSAAGRKAIVAATKRRWAAFHAKAGTVKPARQSAKKPKRAMSPAVKARLAANLARAGAAKADERIAQEQGA